MDWRQYDTARAYAYDLERTATDGSLVETRELVVAELASLPRPLVIDVGAGTGLWSDRLTRWLAVPVLAVEPSAAMLSVARDKHLAEVVMVQARGEALPIHDSACGAAWLSTVVHHFTDLSKAATEIRRVVADDGLALVRSGFPDQRSGDVYPTRFFPSAQQVAGEFPSLIDVVGAFAAAGMRLQRRFAPSEVIAASRTAFLQRVARRADSLLRQVSDDEFRQGMDHAREWADAAPDQPVSFRPDVLIFQ